MGIGRARTLVAALVVAIGGVALTSSESVWAASNKYSSITAVEVIHMNSGPAGAELTLDRPQGHKIQFLRGGAARVSIWDGTRYLPKVFTSVESREESRVCLARTRGWTGGCLTFRSNGSIIRCGYLWNNGARGETICHVRPMGEI
jgi:hypothetical protein